MVQKLDEMSLLRKFGSPEWCRNKLLPILILLGERSESELHEACRVGTIDQIKYKQGKFDEIHTLYSMINGATNPNQTPPSRTGQFLSMFGLGGKENAG